MDNLSDCHDHNVLVDKREIFLHGHIGSGDEDPGTDYRMANIFLKNIRLLEHKSKKDIIVHQHNAGGNWSEGMMIFDAIQTCKCRVIVITHGVAASMGAIIPQAADVRITMPNCTWMVHHGTLNIDNCVYRQTKEWVRWNEEIANKMIAILVDSMESSDCWKGKTQEYLHKYIQDKLLNKEDWILSAQEAVSLGLADEIYNKEYNVS